MKRFFTALLITAAALLLCCCAADEYDEGTSTVSEEAAESIEGSSVEVVSEEESSATVTEDATADVTSDGTADAESSDVTSDETSTQSQPIYSADTTSEQEMIPDLYLGPQPEGDYHTLYVGEEMQLYSGIVGSELEDAMLVWDISENNIIAFSNKKVTALNPGTVTITLSYSNGLKPVSLTFVILPAEESSEG